MIISPLFSVVCFWSTFVAMLLASIGSGILMIFRRKFAFIVPITLLYSAVVILFAKDSNILTRMRSDYYTLLNIQEQIGILLFWLFVLGLQYYQWKKKA